MSDPFELPQSNDPIPNSARLVNAILDAARRAAELDSVPPGSTAADISCYPFRVIYVRNSGQHNFYWDWPVPIQRPANFSTDKLFTEQVVYEATSPNPGWSSWARPLYRIKPGEVGPAVILGWIGYSKLPKSVGAYVVRRCQPQRAYGGTALIGPAYAQAAWKDFPRPVSAWNQDLVGLRYSGDSSARFPKMESLGFRTLLPYYNTWLVFKNPSDQHCWWTPTVEFRSRYASQQHYGPSGATLRVGNFSIESCLSADPIFWRPAVAGFNATPTAYSRNFNFDPMVTGEKFNPNGGQPPEYIYQKHSLPVNFSTKNEWQAYLSEECFLYRSFAGNGMYQSEPSYGFSLNASMPQGWASFSTFTVADLRYFSGPEVIQIFETDRDDCFTSTGLTVDPGIGSGPVLAPQSSSEIGPQLTGAFAVAPTSTSNSQWTQPTISGGYSGRTGSGSMSTGASLFASGASGIVSGVDG